MPLAPLKKRLAYNPEDGIEYPPAGKIVGAVVGIVDCGKQNITYQGKSKTSQQIFIVFQLEETRKNGEPFIVARKMTYSFADNSELGKTLVRIVRKFKTGDEYNIRDLLGKSFEVTIETTENEVEAGQRVHYNIAKDGIATLHRKDSPIPIEDQREHLFYEIPDPIPDLSWIPYHYGQSIEDIIKDSKDWDATGGYKEAAPATSRTPASSAVARDELIGRAEGHLSRAASLGESEGAADFKIACDLLKEHKIRDEELSDDARRILDCPF